MDALPAQPAPSAIVAEAPPPAARFVAPGDLGPRTDEERQLCEKAARPDFLYLGGLLALDVGAVLAHPWLKYAPTQGERALGPMFIGLAWGATLGGGVLATPQCDPLAAPVGPPEGEIRKRWPLTIAVSTIAAATAPFITGIVTGPLDRRWTYGERSSRMWLAALSGLTGSLLPHIPFLSPKPYRAVRQLERLRVEPNVAGVGVSYTLTF